MLRIQQIRRARKARGSRATEEVMVAEVVAEVVAKAVVAVGPEDAARIAGVAA